MALILIGKIKEFKKKIEKIKKELKIFNEFFQFKFYFI